MISAPHQGTPCNLLKNTQSGQSPQCAIFHQGNATDSYCSRISKEIHDRVSAFNETPGWRNGRRKGLKIPYPQGCVGSTPTPGTTTKHLTITVFPKEYGGFQSPCLFSFSNSLQVNTASRKSPNGYITDTCIPFEKLEHFKNALQAPPDSGNIANKRRGFPLVCRETTGGGERVPGVGGVSMRCGVAWLRRVGVVACPAGRVVVGVLAGWRLFMRPG